MKTLNYNRIFFAGSIFVITLFFIMNLYTPLIADDFSHSLGIYSVFDILIYQYNQYFNWGGRCVAHFFAQFWLLAGKPFFNIANTIVYCFFILLVQFHITGKSKKPDAGLFLAVNIFFWFFVPAWGQNFLWLTGSCNYLWTTTIILFFLVPFRKKYDRADYILNIPLSVLFFLLGVLAGWSNENSGAALLFLLLVYFIVKIANKRKAALFEVLGAAGFLLGFSLLIAAPGNYVRMEVIHESGGGYSDNPFTVIFQKRFYDITVMFIKNNGWIFFLISLFFGFDLIFHQKRKIHFFSWLYALAVPASAYSMLLSPAFPDRAFFTVVVFLAITFGSVVTQMNLRLPNIIRRNGFLFFALALFLLSLSFLSASRNVLGIYLRWQDRVEYILAEKEKGNLEAVVKPINASDKHTALYGLFDVDDDKNGWLNGDIAGYFGLVSIEKEGDIPSKIILGKNRIGQLIISPWKRMSFRKNHL